MKEIKRREFLHSVFGGCAGWGIVLSGEGRIRKEYPPFAHPSLRPDEKKPPSAGNCLDYQKARQDDAGVLIRVLGTAQDGGIPQLGCYCQNCLRARKDSRFTRLVSSLAIMDLKEKNTSCWTPLRISASRQTTRWDAWGLKNREERTLPMPWF